MSGPNGGFRMMHPMIRVKDLDAWITFYTGLLGMTLLRRDDYPGGQFTNAFVGYGPEDGDCVVELTFNWGQAGGYELGTGFGHLALGVRDIHGICDALSARVPRSPASPARCCMARPTSPLSRTPTVTRSS